MIWLLIDCYLTPPPGSSAGLHAVRVELEAVGRLAEDARAAQLVEGPLQDVENLLASTELAIIIADPALQHGNCALGLGGVDEAVALLVDGADDALTRTSNHLSIGRRLLLGGSLLPVSVLLVTG